MTPSDRRVRERLERDLAVAEANPDLTGPGVVGYLRGRLAELPDDSRARVADGAERQGRGTGRP